MSPELTLAMVRWIGPVIRAALDDPVLTAIRLHYKAMELTGQDREAVTALARFIANDDAA